MTQAPMCVYIWHSTSSMDMAYGLCMSTLEYGKKTRVETISHEIPDASRSLLWNGRLRKSEGAGEKRQQI